MIFLRRFVNHNFLLLKAVPNLYLNEKSEKTPLSGFCQILLKTNIVMNWKNKWINMMTSIL